jgi:segregation and condensation protein A
LFSSEEGRDGVIVTIIAVLELLKDRMIEIVQSEVFAPIYVKPADRHIEEGSQDGE